MSIFIKNLYFCLSIVNWQILIIKNTFLVKKIYYYTSFQLIRRNWPHEKKERWQISVVSLRIRLILALILASPALKYKKHLAVNKYLSVLPLSPALKDTPYAQNFCSWLWKTIVEQWHFWTIHYIPIILLSLLKVQELTF